MGKEIRMDDESTSVGRRHVSHGSATIKDVAELAKVSIATVSRVLNHLGVVNPDTERKVLSAMKMLNYQRNEVARSLKTRTTKLIGIIAPELSNTFFSEIVEQLERQLGPLGYAMLFCSSQNSVEEEKRRLRLLLERNVDALVVIPTGDTGDHFIGKAFETTPLVMIDRQIPGLDVDLVLTDNKKGAYEVTTSLIREGHKRIGFLGGDLHVHTATERLHGFLSAMHAYGLPVEKEFVMMDGMSQQTGHGVMRKVLEHEDRPDTFFIVNDMVHVGASSYLYEFADAETKRRIVFGAFDYLHYAPLLRFCHYAVAQPLEKMGEAAAQLLIKRLGGDRSDFPKKIVIPPTIKVMTANGGLLTDDRQQAAVEVLEDIPRLDCVFS
ncbi:MAG: LacI family DNA-binding transcriptional regulator [Sphaerochaetaceae bacterium]|jgi:LacI family transcriptional regulator